MWSIKRGTMEAVLLAAKNTFPNEFFCLFGGDTEKKCIDEFVVIPAIFGQEHTIVQSWMKPIDKRIVGSVHSHPSTNNYPSCADLNVFPDFGQVHLIIGYPCRIQGANLFDLKGKKIEFLVVD
jgi:proteasome lid subunit RPN8/RPN11